MITDFIKDLGESILREIVPGKKMAVITKENFKENLNFQIERLTNFLNAVNKLSPAERQQLASRIYTASNNRENTASNLYVQLARQLNKSDLKIAYDSFTTVAANYVTTLENIDRNSAILFKDKALTIYNTKLSQVAVFGLLGEVETFTNCATYMLDQLTYEICQTNGIKELPAPKPYRMTALTNKFDEFVIICKNRLINNARSIASEIDRLRSTADINLVSNNNTVNTGFIATNKLSPLSRNLVGTGARKFVVFRWLGEQWSIIKHQKYLKNKKEKEWMESHVALLKLQLQNLDPNSEEYRKQVKIIDAYNEMITSIDQKINSYLEDN